MNKGGGVPLSGVLVVALLIFWTYISQRTLFGRHVYAVGGNAEAARRAGINVPRIKIIVFMISSAMAARRASVNHIASIVQNVDPPDLRHSAETIDLNF